MKTIFTIQINTTEERGKIALAVKNEPWQKYVEGLNVPCKLILADFSNIPYIPKVINVDEKTNYPKMSLSQFLQAASRKDAWQEIYSFGEPGGEFPNDSID